MSNQFAVRINMALALLLMLVICIGIDAQAQSGGLLLRETTSGLEIAVVDETGVVSSVLQSLPNYGFESSSGATWVLHPDPQIPTRRDLALSPDGTQLAFVAVQNQTQFQLLVYQQATNTLIEESLSAYAYPTWSPDGQELLLEMVYVPNGSTLPESTIYLPSSNTFRQLTSDIVGLERRFQWLPDGNSIIYQKNDDIFLTDAFGTSHQQLTQLGQQLLPDVTAFVCDRVWSPVSERIYFSVGCPDGVEYLYSVDLNGNVRFELSVTALYPEDYDPTFVPVSISAIFPDTSTTDVFVVTGIQILNTSDGSQDRQIAIYRLTAPENTQLIFERVYTFDIEIGIAVSDISPDQSYIALAGGNGGRDNSFQVIVVDLSDGSTSFEQSGLQGVCNLNWLDGHTLAYGIIPRLNCIYDRFAISTESVDVLTGNVTSISSSPSMIGTPIEYLYASASGPD